MEQDNRKEGLKGLKEYKEKRTDKPIEKPYEKQQEYQVRCNACTKLLGMFKVAVGVIKCPRCNHTQQIDIGGTEQRHRAV